MRTSLLFGTVAVSCLVSPLSVASAHAAATATVRTPAGSIAAECVHQVGNDAVVSTGVHADTIRAANGVEYSVGHCQRPVTPRSASRSTPLATGAQLVNPDGWQLNANYATPRPVAYMHATFAVPQFPQGGYQGQTDYLFPALETSDGSTIAQPVLDYGNFGQANWEMTAWYGNSNGMFHTPPITVGAGDVLYGSMFRGCTGSQCSWTITLTDRTTHQSTSIRTTDDFTFTWAFPAALETYSITDCSLLPGSSTTFSNVWVADADGHEMAPSEYSNSNGTPRACGERVVQNTRARSVTLVNSPA